MPLLSSRPRQHHTTVTTRAPRAKGGLFSRRTRATPVAPSHHHHHTTTTTTTRTTRTTAPRRGGLFSGRAHAAPVVHHKRKPSMGDKISGAMLKLKGTLTRRPGQKAAGTRRMHGTDGRGARRRY